MHMRVTWNNYSHYFHFFFVQGYNKKIREKYMYVPNHLKQVAHPCLVRPQTGLVVATFSQRTWSPGLNRISAKSMQRLLLLLLLLLGHPSLLGWMGSGNPRPSSPLHWEIHPLIQSPALNDHILI